MKKISRFFLPFSLLIVLVVSAWGVAFARDLPNLATLGQGAHEIPAMPRYDPEIEITGTVEAVTAESLTVDGKTIALTAMTEIKDMISVGDTVKIEALADNSGSLVAREVELADTSMGANSQNGFMDDDDDLTGSTITNTVSYPAPEMSSDDENSSTGITSPSPNGISGKDDFEDHSNTGMSSYDSHGEDHEGYTKSTSTSSPSNTAISGTSSSSEENSMTSGQSSPSGDDHEGGSGDHEGGDD